jgi:hypothetical protein
MPHAVIARLRSQVLLRSAASAAISLLENDNGAHFWTPLDIPKLQTSGGAGKSDSVSRYYAASTRYYVKDRRQFWRSPHDPPKSSIFMSVGIVEPEFKFPAQQSKPNR